MKCRYHAAAVIVLLTFFILNSVVYDVSGADSSPGNLYALSAVLMDGDSGRVLYEKEGETPRPNASTTKVLTCILALENGQGDVLIAWENEAFLSVRDNPDDYEIVTPGISILAQPSVAVVDENVKKHDNAEAAKAYLKYLYSDEAQELIAENYYRPIDQTILKKHADTFDLKVKLTTIKDFGGWDAVQKKHFADGGVFDEIYEE